VRSLKSSLAESRELIAVLPNEAVDHVSLHASAPEQNEAVKPLFYGEIAGRPLAKSPLAPSRQGVVRRIVAHSSIALSHNHGRAAAATGLVFQYRHF